MLPMILVGTVGALIVIGFVIAIRGALEGKRVQRMTGWDVLVKRYRYEMLSGGLERIGWRDDPQMQLLNGLPEVAEPIRVWPTLHGVLIRLPSDLGHSTTLLLPWQDVSAIEPDETGAVWRLADGTTIRSSPETFERAREHAATNGVTVGEVAAAAAPSA
jgi:hypothetical protein